MASYTITVSLNTGATPPVTASPDAQEVDFGTDTIYWIPTSSQIGDWEFKTISFAEGAPFNDIDVNDQTIRAIDENENTTSSNSTFSYTLGVKAGNTFYYSDPSIINKSE